MGFISHHITPPVNDSLGADTHMECTHTHTYTHTHTHTHKHAYRHLKTKAIMWVLAWFNN